MSQLRYVPPHLQDNNAPIPLPIDPPAYLFELEADLWNQSLHLRRLLSLKNELRGHPSVEKHFQHNRRMSAQSTPEDSLSQLFLNQYFTAMGEIIQHTGDVLLHVTHFLDIGCAPGGYSKRILVANPNACGEGVTLAHDKGGLAMTLGGWDETVQERFSVLEGNITSDSMRDQIKQRGPFDLVIAGVTFRDVRTNTDNADLGFHDHSTDQVELELLQLGLALESLEQGGTLLVTLSMDGGCQSTIATHQERVQSRLSGVLW